MKMKTKRYTLFMPLLFGGLVIAIGFFARKFVDHALPIAASGTHGMLVWILAPPLLALLFKRLDSETHDRHFFTLRRDTAIFALAVSSIAGTVGIGVIAVGWAIGSLIFVSAPVSASALVLAGASIALFALLEESAWRGYLLPSLLPRARYPIAVAVAALIWFAWHLPYLDRLSAGYTKESLATLSLRLLFGVVTMQFLFTELFLRYRSVWPAFALHATMNLVVQLAIMAGLSLNGPRAWLLSPSADGALVIAVSGGVGFWLHRRREFRNGRFLPGESLQT